MEARELRIGNIVGCKMSLDGYVTVPNLGVEAFFTHLRNGAYHPIPLTEEWLLKMGFIDCYKNEKEPRISLDRYNDSIWNCYLINGDKKEGILRKIKYVHQLQNLYYALTNTELTINL